MHYVASSFSFQLVLLLKRQELRSAIANRHVDANSEKHQERGFQRCCVRRVHSQSVAKGAGCCETVKAASWQTVTAKLSAITNTTTFQFVLHLYLRIHVPRYEATVHNSSFTTLLFV